MKKEIETADTIITSSIHDAPFSHTPDWKGLLGETMSSDESGATLLVAERKTLKPSTSQSIRIGAQDLPLPHHTISPESAVVDFQIISTLGKGGMGVVHLARQSALAREVAIKQLLPDQATPSARQNLLIEACITGRLEHPNIVPVYSLGIDEHDRPLFVMKRIEGVSWHAALHDERLLPRAYRQFDDPMESHFEIFEQVCLAMHYAHSKGIIHRDLKPENVMLGAYGEVYVVDWGIAVSIIADEQGLLPLASDARQVVGTPMYMAPEQASAESDLLNAHTDVYALGAMLHELITGKPRHDGNTLQAVLLNAYHSAPAIYPPEISPQLGAICNRACARDPADRFSSAEALREALATWRNHRRAEDLIKATTHRLDELDAIYHQSLEEMHITSAQMVRAHTLIGACRFGLEHALEIKPDDALADTTLRHALNTMLGIELVHENLPAASVLHSELGEHVSRENAQRMKALVLKLERDSAHIQSLKKLEHGVDFSVSRKRKGLFALSLCVVWSAGSLFLKSFLGDATTIDEIYFSATLYKVLVSSVILVLWLIARRTIHMTMLNRKLLHSVPVILIFGLVVRLLAWKIGIALFEGIAMELMCYAIVAAMLSALIDRWFIVPCSIYTAGSALLLFVLPEQAGLLFGVCNLLALAFVSWRWFSGRGSWMTVEHPDAQSRPSIPHED